MAKRTNLIKETSKFLRHFGSRVQLGQELDRSFVEDRVKGLWGYLCQGQKDKSPVRHFRVWYLQPRCL